MPPSTNIVCPFTKLEAADDRNTHTPTSSSTLPHLPAGVRFSSQAENSGSATKAAVNFVSKYPGAIALICSHLPAQSVAIPFVMFATAPFVVVYGAMPGRASIVWTEAILIIFPLPLFIICLATA